jgi:hypothetical protein
VPVIGLLRMHMHMLASRNIANFSPCREASFHTVRLATHSKYKQGAGRQEHLQEYAQKI